MKIQILSDLHIEFETYEPMTDERLTAQIIMTETPADVVVLAGDIHTKGRGPGTAFERFKGKQVVMVVGNHEYYGQSYPNHLNELRENASLFNNVHFMENQAVEISGVVFLGCTMWTDFKLFEGGPYAGLYSRLEAIHEAGACMNDYRKIMYYGSEGYRKLLPGDTVQLHLDSVRWLREQFNVHKDKKIVVVTHSGPSFKSVSPAYKKDVLSAAFASNLDSLVEQSGAVLWVHGHSHDYCDYTIGKTRVVCNPHGYPFENTNFKPDLIVEV